MGRQRCLRSSPVCWFSWWAAQDASTMPAAAWAGSSSVRRARWSRFPGTSPPTPPNCEQGEGTGASSSLAAGSQKNQTAAWQAKGRVCRESLGRLTPAVWKAQPFLRHLLNYILKLLSVTLIVLVLRSLLRKDMVRHNAKRRLNFKQASLVL